VDRRLPAANLEKALAVLAPEQRERWDKMLGKPLGDRSARLMTDPLTEKTESQ
jgi:hypothetical protein